MIDTGAPDQQKNIAMSENGETFMKLISTPFYFDAVKRGIKNECI